MSAIFHDGSIPENYINVGGVRTAFGEHFVAIVTKTTTYVVTLLDHVILCNASGGAFTVTLPTAASGKIVYHIKKIDSSSNAVTVDGNGSETIDDELIKIISIQHNSMMVVSDLSNWHII